jgi:hypothetical protein
MQVTSDTTVVESIPRGAPVIPATPLPASPVADAVAADRRNRQDDRRNPSASPARFRSVLDAVTVAGLGRISGQVSGQSNAPISTDGVTEPATTVTRAGAPSRDVSAQESEKLFRAARAYTAQPKPSAPREADTADNDAAPVLKNAALNASKRYAQSFFALDRTFAARGETLEIST